MPSPPEAPARRRIYVAAPLFNPGERAHNVRIRTVLEPWFAVHLPQSDGALLPDLMAQGMTPAEARRGIFKEDVAAVHQADLLLAVLNGACVDEGVAFELGVAWSLGKPCFGYKDDFRQQLPDGGNPMVEGALKAIFGGLDELAAWARAHAALVPADHVSAADRVG